LAGGRPAEARATLNRALAIHPGDIRARCQLALAESADDHDARAAVLLEGVIKDAPDLTKAHNLLATLYFRLSR
jgi:Tfp pilus assembly protein PilF